MELFKIHSNKPDNSKIVVKYYMYVLKQIVYNHARVSRDVACVQVPPQRKGVCITNRTILATKKNPLPPPPQLR